MRALGAALLLAVGGCSWSPQYFPTQQEQVISLRKGDLESAGVAFITPSTVTGQEEEKQAVALTFAEVLKMERPALKVATLAETLGAVNRAGLADGYRAMYEHYRDTGLFPAPVLQRVGNAVAARYLVQLKLQGFSQSAKNRFGLLGLRLVETQYADLRLFLQVWDSAEGRIAWEAMQELRISVDTTSEQPVMLRKLLERSAHDLVAKLP
jgi:hypothetical protein